MLTVVTGLPGAGKTLFLLAKILPQYRGRKIHVYNVPGINHEHFGTQELVEPEKWFELPEASVVVIDEAQKIFPLRKAGSEVPPKCSHFETHRHRGFDVVLLTQDATTLDVHVRKLCGKHIHVHRLFGGNTANVYEYPEFTPMPADAKSRRLALQSTTFHYPKQIFDHYKSADAHTVKRQIPKKLFVLPLLLVGVVACVLFAISKVGSMINNAESFVESAQAAEAPGGQSADNLSASLSWQGAFLPAVDGLPWTAPAYVSVMQVRSAPKPLCVIKETIPPKTRCYCYTQQITLMTGVPNDVCRDIARNGWFDYTLEDGRSEKARQRQSERHSDEG